jgi:hypothetical protein
MHQILIINTIVCILGFFGGGLFAGASIISIANMKVPWSSFLLVAAFIIPLMFLVSGVGAWIAYSWGYSGAVGWAIALPWIYALIFIILMFRSF